MAFMIAFLASMHRVQNFNFLCNIINDVGAICGPCWSQSFVLGWFFWPWVMVNTLNIPITLRWVRVLICTCSWLRHVHPGMRHTPEKDQQGYLYHAFTKLSAGGRTTAACIFVSIFYIIIKGIFFKYSLFEWVDNFSGGRGGGHVIMRSIRYNQPYSIWYPYIHQAKSCIFAPWVTPNLTNQGRTWQNPLSNQRTVVQMLISISLMWS